MEFDDRVRDPLVGLPPFLVAAPGAKSSRRQQAAQARRRAGVDVANRAIEGVRQLAAGKFDDSLLRASAATQPQAQLRPTQEEARQRILATCMSGLPRVDRPRGDAAVKRLLGGRIGQRSSPVEIWRFLRGGGGGARGGARSGASDAEEGGQVPESLGVRLAARAGHDADERCEALAEGGGSTC